ncbi:unnamed protein product [Pedinophyceae sp. YPF-701]|nr:unnamed protein product [Pedinophyceae sp. YPF-701]
MKMSAPAIASCLTLLHRFAAASQPSGGLETSQPAVSGSQTAGSSARTMLPHIYDREVTGADLRILAAAALFTGSKLEEHPLRTNDLLNAVWVVCQLVRVRMKQFAQSARTQGHEQAPSGRVHDDGFDAAGQYLAGEDPALDLRLTPGRLAEALPDLDRTLRRALALSRPGGPQPLARLADGIDAPGDAVPLMSSEAYYAAKEKLLEAEQLILRAVRFQVVLEDPHRYLFNIIHELGLGEGPAKLATCVLNDALVYTALPGRCSAAALATAALLMSGEVLGPTAVRESPTWWRRVGADAGEVEAAANGLARMIAALQRGGAGAQVATLTTNAQSS